MPYFLPLDGVVLLAGSALRSTLGLPLSPAKKNAWPTSLHDRCVSGFDFSAVFLQNDALSATSQTDVASLRRRLRKKAVAQRADAMPIAV
jgi:hypothetical protein